MGKRGGLTLPVSKQSWKSAHFAPRPRTGVRCPFCREDAVRPKLRVRQTVSRLRLFLPREATVTLSLQEAARRLNGGGVILYPTETFFGIGCRADNAEAVLRVFSCKKRSLSMPLPVILGSREQLELVACPGPALAEDLAELSSFWPGPLTLLLPAKSDLPEALTGGSGKIAARVSSHPAARALAESCGFPVVSSSANISGRQAVTLARDLDPELLLSLQPDTDGVLDEPPVPGGGEASTIVEPLGGHRVRVLRKGALPLADLEAAGFSLLSSDFQEIHA